MSIIRGEISIVDLTDSRSLVAYISSNNRRQVIYDPDTDSYLPDFSEDPLTLTPELYIAGGGANIVDQVSSLRWTAQTNSTGRFEEITNGNGYSIGSSHELTINRNIFEDLTSILFRVEMVYHDDGIDRDIYVQADIELVRLSNGQTGRDGSSGDSSYVWVRYSTHSDGRDMSPNPDGTIYMGITTTLDSEPPSNPSAYQWAEIKGDQGVPGETGDDGLTSYLHIKYSNDGGETFTANNGETVGDWMGTYVDFEPEDSDNVEDYTWNRVKGDDGVGIESITEYYRVHTANTGITEGGTGWVTTIPTLTPTNKYLWNYEKVTYTNGVTIDLKARVIGVYGDTGTSIDKIEEFYLVSPSNTGITHSSPGWSSSMVVPTAVNKYIWNYEKITYKNPARVENKAPRIIGVYGDRGERGPRGLEGLQGPEGKQGIQGPAGSDGRHSYTHIAYATGDQGQTFSHDTFPQATHIGMYVSHNQNSSDNWRDYEWTEIRGKDGSQGIPGPKGDDGRTPYFHTAWANNANGTSGFSTTVSTNKLYIGTYTSFESADSNDPAMYSWTRIKGDKGDKGDTGATGTGVTGTTIHYTNHTSGTSTPTSGWSTSVPTPIQGRFLWTRTVTSYSDGTNATTYSIAYNATDGQRGDDGNGIDSTEVRYQQTTSGTAIPTGTWSTTIPTPVQGRYLWTRTIVSYTDGTSSTSYNTSYYATDGQKGDKGDPGEDAVLLTIETPDGTTIRNSEGTLRAVSELFVGTSTITSGLTYKWYKRQPGASGDADSGAGWQRLTSSTNFGTTGFNTGTLTIPEEGITGNATYMVIVTYEARRYRRQVSVYDITDPYTVSVLGDSFFRNGRGVNTYEAKLYRNGEEVDESGDSGYSYLWHQYDSSGQLISGFQKVGKRIEVSGEEVRGKSDLRVTITRGG